MLAKLPINPENAKRLVDDGMVEKELKRPSLTIFLSALKGFKEESIMPKREDYISWDEYFMGVSLLASMRSKDPSTQVGACIVSDENKIMSVGYNGFPRGCSDDDFPWERSAENSNDTKYPFVCHAELNAILNAGGQDLRGARIFVALFPCNECAKAIIQSGIKEVVYSRQVQGYRPRSRRVRECLKAQESSSRSSNSDKKLEIDFNEENI